MSATTLGFNELVGSDQSGSNDRKDEGEERPAVLSAGKTEDEIRESDRALRQLETQQILVDANQRDDAATARDVVSDKREIVADLKAFLSREGSYAGLDERRASALDRLHAKGDREASAQDRTELTKPDPDPDTADRTSEGP